MDSNKQIAAGLTFLIACCIFISLLLTRMGWDRPWPVQPDPYIEMAMAEPDEFIEVEVIKPDLTPGVEPSAPALTPEDMDNPSQPAPQTGTQLNARGPQGDPAQTVTTDRPSPVKVEKKPQPEKPGNPAPTPEELEKQRQQALAKQSLNTTQNAFANVKNKGNANNGSEDKGLAGRTKGNAESAGPAKSTGTRTGAASGTVGGGWKSPVFSRNIQSNEVGTVTFEVQVNADGTVGKITEIGGSGLTSATKANCRADIRSKRYTHPHPEVAEPTTARVTFIFQDPK